MIYRFLFRMVLARMPAEAAHSLAGRVARWAGGSTAVRAALRRRHATTDPALAVDALGHRFPSPLGAAAGIDKDATWFEFLGALGFGFVEVGTVTAVPQPGNEGARMWRLIADRGLLNRLGFPNLGAEAAARHLSERTGDALVGVNVGKSRSAPIEGAGADYRLAVGRLAGRADYLVVNVSSPNTPGLRSLQAIDPLRTLVAEVRSELASTGPGDVPLLLKIAPDLGDEEVDAIADLALELGLDGIVATNTTSGREGLRSSPDLWAHDGGVSGAPLRARSLAVLARLRARAGDRLTLVSVGGIESAEDVWERILAGATLVQAYTGFVYGGPLWPSRVNRDLARLVRESRWESVGDAVGRGAPAPGPLQPQG